LGVCADTFYKTYLRETIILVGYILTSKNEIIPEQNDAKNWNYQNVFKRAGRYPQDIRVSFRPSTPKYAKRRRTIWEKRIIAGKCSLCDWIIIGIQING